MVDKVAKQTEVQKVKVKTKTVNQEVVERKICVLPRETRSAYREICAIKSLRAGVS